MTEPRTPPSSVSKKAPAVEPRRPYHLGVAIGLSAGVYASSLAAVSVLQFQDDQQLIADRQPVGDAISILGQHHEAMAGDIAEAQAVFEEASGRYGSVVEDIGNVRIAVKRLGRLIVRLEGTSTDFRMPSMVSLPSVPSKPSATKPDSKPAPPPSNGGTGASGKP